MLPAIENLLILQDRDRKIMRVEAELANLAPERNSLELRAKQASTKLDAGKLKAKQIESDRKKLELDVEAKKQLIEKYSLQQFQTKKNEEYKALAHEIDTCKAAISKLDDEQLVLMEQLEAATREANEVSKETAGLLKDVELARTALADKEVRLKKELADLKSDPKLWREITIWIKKRPDDEMLPTNEDVLRNRQQKNSKSKRGN